MYDSHNSKLYTANFLLFCGAALSSLPLAIWGIVNIPVQMLTINISILL